MMRRLLLLVTITFCAGRLSAETITYRYDEAGRLLRAQYGKSTAVEYTYDAAGNITKRRIGAPSPVLTVVKPNGGEVIKKGKGFSIKWKTAGELDRVTISLVRKVDLREQVTALAVKIANTGKFRWAVGSRLKCSQCKIRISGDGAIADDSNGYFEVK